MQGFTCIRVSESDEEQGHVVLPRQAAVSCQIDFGADVPVSVGAVGDGEFLVVGLVVDIPAAEPGELGGV